MPTSEPAVAAAQSAAAPPVPPSAARRVSRRTPTPPVWRNAVLAVFLVNGLGIGSWLSRLPTIRDSLHADDSGMSFLVFGLASGALVGLLAASHVVAHLGTRASIRTSLVLVAVGLTVAGVAAGELGNYSLTVAGLALFGLGNSVCDVSMNLQGARAERALGRTVMPLFHASFSGGTMIGAGLGALAERLGVPLFAHMGSIAVVLLVGMAVSLVHLPDDESAGGPAGDPTAPGASVSGWRARLSIWRDPATLLIGLVVLGMAYAEGSAGDWLTLAMVDGHGVSHSGGALIYGVFVTAMTAGRVLGGRVLDRYGRVPVLRITGGLAVAGLLIVIFVPSAAVAVIGVACWGLGASLGFPVGMSAAADDPARAAARVSAVATIGYLAFLVGPPAIGLLAGRVGLLHALLVVVVVAGLATLAAPAAREHHPA